MITATMTDPLTPPLQDSLAVALRTSLDDPALVNEPVTLPDLADVLSEVWRDDVLRQGHPEVPLAAASMRVYPSMSPSSHTRCDGFQVEVSLPGRAARSHPFSIHSLRHAYATHQLEAGLPVHRLQRLLGHKDLHSTLRYVHWVPQREEGRGEQDLIGRLGEVSHD